ncbi:phosphoesterase [Candidatus Woesearchaeota archaeon]|nr:phosphoesterase [Candidatus Woesearchaeota archaeon]
MEISKGIEIIDLGLKIGSALIIGDLHIGYEEALNKQGVMVPRFQFRDILKRMTAILRKAKPDIVVLNGDIKHEFGTISEQEWRETLKIIDLILKYAKKLVLVRGNHDTILGPIAKKRHVEIVDTYQIDDGMIVVLHGHKEVKLPKNTKTIIIGHDHPAVSLREGPRVEVFKCFLKGEYKKKELIVMPSFNLVTEGSDMTREKSLSPYLKQDLDNFRVYIVSDKVYDFGRLKDIPE